MVEIKQYHDTLPEIYAIVRFKGLWKHKIYSLSLFTLIIISSFQSPHNQIVSLLSQSLQSLHVVLIVYV
jgi:hypothetical protein